MTRFQVLLGHPSVVLMGVACAFASLTLGLYGPNWVWALVPLGVVAQYLNEYNLHRYVFHLKPPRRQWAFDLLYRAHYGHHDFPTNHKLFFVPVWVALPMLAVNFLGLWALLSLFGVGQAFWIALAIVPVGGVATFLGYEWFHMSAHLNVPKGPLARHVTKLHNQHHFRDFSKWFHVSPGGVVAFFSLEMSAEQLAGRILAEASEISSHKIRQGDMEEFEFRRFVEAAKELEACPLYIDDTAAIPIAQLAARARRLKRTHGLDVLIVDYLQLVRGTSENRVQEIGEISMGLKAIAKELQIPVIALSQLSRQVESRDDKRPQLSDLRESGSIEQDADVVMFVYRGEYYKEREKPDDDNLEAMAQWQDDMARLHGKAEVIIGKQRHGPIGTVELSFEAQFTRFGNLAKAWQTGGDDQGF